MGRSQHNMTVAHIARLLLQHKVSCCVSLVSPYTENRETARSIVGDTYRFIEVYVKCSLSTCEARDIKGMYTSARKGEIRQFTGVDDVYQFPSNPDLTIDTENSTVEFATECILQYLNCTRDNLK
jgi:adenylylsulfate kinase-like enzyme